jgi:hypothetical protein
MSFSKFGNYRYTLRDSARRGLSRNTAMLQRIAKEKTPENFCPVASCLYRILNGQTGEYTPCPKHLIQSDIARAMDEGLDVWECFG